MTERDAERKEEERQPQPSSRRAARPTRQETGREAPWEHGEPSPSMRDPVEPRSPTQQDAVKFLKVGRRLIEAIVKKSVQHSDQVVHGGQAVNVQVPRKFRKGDTDWDIYARRAKENADRIEDALDSLLGCDMFYCRVEKLPDGRMMYRVISRATQRSVIDYIPNRNQYPPYIIVENIKFETIYSLREKAMRNLQRAQSEERRREIVADLRRINAALQEIEKQDTFHRGVGVVRRLSDRFFRRDDDIRLMPRSTHFANPQTRKIVNQVFYGGTGRGWL